LYTFSTTAKLFLLLCCLFVWAVPAAAQDIEPRRWAHIPTGTSFVALGYGLSEGDIFFSPILLIEDGNFDLHSFAASYVHAFDIGGKSARFDVVAPLAMGRWEGTVDGEYTSVRRHGLGDPNIRMSVHLAGAPSLSGKAWLEYQRQHPVNTIVGAAVSLKLPVGQYSSDRLINLGANRWVLRPQLGVLHQHNKWSLELTGSAFLFSKNHDFWMDTKFEQDPLFALQTHFIYNFRPGLWVSIGTGYGIGGRSSVSGGEKSERTDNWLYGLSVGIPINARQGLKIGWYQGRTQTSIGQDIEGVTLGWSYMFGL
jgi:hypothetical protein